MDLNTKPNVLIPTADGFEEIELVSILDILRRAEANVILASITNNLHLTGAHNIKIQCDNYIKDNLQNNWNMIVLAGGLKNAESLSQDKNTINLLMKQNEQKKWIAAICASPALVLTQSGLIENNEATSYPGFSEKFKNKNKIQDKIVVSNNFITSQGPGTAMEFSLKIVEILFNKKIALNLAKKLIFKTH